MSEPDSQTSASPASEAGAFSALRRLAAALLGDSSTKTIRDSLEEVIEESERSESALSPQERVMLSNLLKFGELRVDDVMVPRADIVAVEEGLSMRDLLEAFRDAQHSRLPVYRETLDDPIGIVHVKDVLALIEVDGEGVARVPDTPISRIKRDLIFVPPSMPARELLLKMQTTHSHLALVIDEYGGTDGLVSIEDLVEQIVGDIDDEHDVDEDPQLRILGGDIFEADARLDLDDFCEQTGIDLAPDGEEEVVDTLAGLVVWLLGRVPQRGEIVPCPPDFEFEVLEADPRRVKRLRLRKAPAAAQSGPE